MRLDEAARHFIGTPFAHQGRNPAVGIDCVGLLVCASIRAGTEHWRSDACDYGQDPHHGLLEARMAVIFGLAVDRGPHPRDLLAGDVVCIDYKGATRHVAIVGEHPLGGLTLIHTSHVVKRVTEHGMNRKWTGVIREVHRPEIGA